MAEHGANESSKKQTRYSITEMADEVGLPFNTVRSHFATLADVLEPDADVGPRGKRIYSQQTFERYKMFLRLKSTDVRLSARDAIRLLRNGHFADLQAAAADPARLLVAVHQLLSTVSEPAPYPLAQKAGS